MPSAATVVAVLRSADATAWATAVAATGGTVSAPRLALVTTLVNSFKTAGVWSSLDRLWLFAAENAQSALIDLVTRSTATVVNSPTFTADRGFQGNGTSAYLNLAYLPSSGANYQQNNALAFVHDESDRGSVPGAAFASRAASSSVSLFINHGGTMYPELNGSGSISPPVSSRGLWALSRLADGEFKVYRDGVLFGTLVSFTGPASALPVYALASNNPAGVGDPSPDRLSAIGFGGGLDATKVAALHTALRTYLTAVGVP